MRDETLAIHAGYKSEPTTKAVTTPIYQTVAYEFDDAAHGAALFNLEVEGNIYSRIMNPTVDVLEKRSAELEGGLAALCVSAGSAAINYSILNIAEKGNNIVTVPLLYGGTYTLFKHMLPRQGIDVRFAKDDSAEALQSLIDDKTTAVFCESIGNPAGNVVDIEALANMAHENGVPLIVDNTVPTAVLTKPIEWGADVVVNSMTKYMGGHGNSLRNTGSALSPMNAFQILQGLATLPLRMERHCDNALAVAKHLEDHPQVEWINFAGLPNSPYYDLAKKYTNGKPSALLSFGIKGGFDAGVKFYDALQLLLRLVNIGDVKSLAAHPASTTHRQ